MNQRIEALCRRLPEDVDGVLVTSEENRYYFTGLRATDGVLLVTRKGSYAILDFRYIEVARRTIKTCEVILQDQLWKQLTDLLSRDGVQRLALETSSLTVGRLNRYKAMLPKAVLLTDDRVDRLILELRSQKDGEELGYIRTAQGIADRAFQEILNFIAPGKIEREIAVELEHRMRLLGAEKTSFDTICVSGPNSSLPHGVPGDRALAAGDFLTMDFGCMVEGYCSDMTRTVAVGHADEEMKKVYDTVLKAQLLALKKVAPGVPCKEVDAAARDLIYSAGYEGCFGHGTGHSVGLMIHEDPRFSPNTDALCIPGLVMTVEPGIYLEGRFGCRIEDMVVVTEDGAENLTNSPKNLIVL